MSSKHLRTKDQRVAALWGLFVSSLFGVLLAGLIVIDGWVIALILTGCLFALIVLLFVLIGVVRGWVRRGEDR